MKKKISNFLFLVLICFSLSIIFFGCNKLDKISKNLTNYNLSLSFKDESKTLNGHEIVDYINSTDVVLDEIWFHLYPNAFLLDAKTKPVSNLYKLKAYPNGENPGKIDVKKVKVENNEQDVVIADPDKETLIVKLNDSLYPDERVVIEIDFNVLLPNCLHRFGYGDNTYNFGNFYPVACIYENGQFQCDAYGNNGDPFYSDMANYNVSIKYENDFTLASSGVQNETIEQDGTKITNILASSVRDFAFVMSKKFNVISGQADNTTVFYYYYKDDYPQDSLKAGIDSILTFSNTFGEYPYSSYSIVETNFIHGGMEYPNLVYISDDTSSKEEYINVIVHETAHQWWYNLVGSNACEFAWLDEGLTEYSTLMFYNKNKDYNVDTEKSLKNSLSNYVLFSDIFKSVYGSFDGRMSKNVNTFKGDMEYVYVTYVKGVLFFDNLNSLVGTKKFEKSLNLYFKENSYKNARPENLISAFEKVCKQNLEGFFDSWINDKIVLQNYS